VNAATPQARRAYIGKLTTLGATSVGLGAGGGVGTQGTLKEALEADRRGFLAEPIAIGSRETGALRATVPDVTLTGSLTATARTETACRSPMPVVGRFARAWFRSA
jgi:hypothetical protein